MMYIYRSLFLYLLLHTNALAAQVDSFPYSGPQLSYSLNLYAPFGEHNDYRGASVDVEARMHENFSLLFNLGRMQAEGSGSWVGLPLRQLAGPEEPPPWPNSRLSGPVLSDTRRFFLGTGGQVNVRIGSGDLALAAMLTLGTTRLRQSASFGDLKVILSGSSNPTTIAPPTGLFGTATIDYHTVLQLGTLIQLHYTYWISHHLALRIGTGIHSHGLTTWGVYRRGSPARYRPREIIYRGAYRPQVDNYSLPDEEDFTTADPTIHRFFFLGLNFGVVYKPAKARN